MNYYRLLVALVFGACASPSAAVPSGSYASECVIDGVRRERGEPDEPFSYGPAPVTLTIRDGELTLYDDCVTPLVDYDGETFAVAPTDCAVLDGTERYTVSRITGGSGSIVDGEMNIEVHVFWDRTVSGWTEEYAVICSGSSP